MNPTKQSTRRRQRLHCINCNICVNTLRRFVVLELDTRIISVVSSWISPLIITDEDYICEACWEIAIQTVNHANDGDDVLDNSGEQQAANSSHQGHRLVCIICGFSLLRRRSDLILRGNASDLERNIAIIIQARIAPRQLIASDRVCHPCWLRSKRSALRAQQTNNARSLTPEGANEPADLTHEAELPEQDLEQIVEIEENTSSEIPDVPVQPVPEQPVPVQPVPDQPEIVLPNYRRAANTASHCLFPGCTSEHLHTMTDSLRATVLGNNKYYIPVLARICMEHLHSNNWDDLYNSSNSISTFTVQQIEHVFSFVNAFKSHLDFSTIEKIQEIDDNLFFYWIGRSKEDFMSLLNEVPRIQEAHRGVLGLAAFLMKMRTGESDDRIAKLLEVPRRTLERLMQTIRELLLQDFVPCNLGINQLPRENLLEHNLFLPNGIYNNENNEKAILICDGTYIYINKSSNYMFQKDTYSLHKYRNLLKPFLIVSCDGYIVDCFGPYKATTSDAEIMTSLFNNENSALRLYLQENDIFILDKGFRDSISLLEACNYRAYMPESLLEGEHQLTTEQANRSRCVTICRWVVEVVNGYFKRDFKLLRTEYFNKTVPHMMENFQIAASLLNRFGVRLRNRDDAGAMLNIIRERMHFENNLSSMVESTNMNRRSSRFTNITADRDNLIMFPRFEMRELILFALGTYQIRQARSYYGEHIRFHGGYTIEISSESIDIAEYNLRGSGNNTLIRGKIKSRHVSRKQYYVYILIEHNIPGREGIPEYCCNCLVGRRTVGCCAHVMTLVWYLGWARYQSNISAPAEFLDSVVIREDVE